MNLLRTLNRRYLLRYRLEYLLVALFAHAIQALSPSFAWRTARRCARLAFRLGLRRPSMLQNLRVAFPDWSEEERERVAERSMEHFASMAVDLMFQRRMVSARNLDEHFRLGGWAKEYFDTHDREWRDRHIRRFIFLTAHFGNWELASGFFALVGVKIATVYRATNNPFLNRFIQSIRLDQHGEVIERRGAVQTMLEKFDRGGNVGTLCDQTALHGLYVPFFGVQVCVHKTPAVLVRDHDVRVAWGVVERLGDFLRYEVRGRELYFDPPTEDKEADLQRISTQMLQAVEEEVRRRPEQYFWLHRRFRPTRTRRIPDRSQEVEVS